MDWIFFDLGSTLIDESACMEKRLRETMAGCDEKTHAAFLNTLHKGWTVNEDGYKAALQAHQLKKTPWRGELERLYPAVPELLGMLKKRYHLGIIANQEYGCRPRLDAWGISRFFEITVLSCEAGVSKPDPSIFLAALEQSGCSPERAWMVGDRLDNDILPAMDLGMKTIWVKQGWGAWGDPALLPHVPTYVIDTIGQVLELFEVVE